MKEQENKAEEQKSEQLKQKEERERRVSVTISQLKALATNTQKLAIFITIATRQKGMAGDLIYKLTEATIDMAQDEHN